MERRDDGVAVVTIDRQDALNALDHETLEELRDRLRELALDTDGRVLVLTGAGERAFAAGADIKEMTEMTVLEGHAWGSLGHECCRLLESMPKPTLAAVNGLALGGGCELALACDIRYASEQARLGQPEINLAVIPGWGGTQRLARAIGPALAGLSVNRLGYAPTFAINAGSYLLLALGLLLVTPRARQLASRGQARLRESFRIAREQPRLLAFLLIVTAVGFASDPVNTESPAFAHAFGYTDTWAGVIVAFFGAGAVTAAFLVAGRVAGSRGRMAVTLGALGAGILLFSVTPWLPLGLPLLALAGFGYLGSNTSATTRLALGVEPWQRGRIMALWSIAFLGLRPVASLVDGAIAGALGVRVAGIVLALPALLGAAFALTTLRSWRSSPASSSSP